MEIPKETLGLAGEYAVASELCKRGIYAQLTLGNRKSVDLLLGRLARSSCLRGEVTREAIHEQGEECRGLGAEADTGVGRTGHDLRQALGGDIQAHWPGGAELGFEDGGGGDGVEEYRRGGVVPGMGTPFGIEGLERRGEGGVRGEKLLPVSAVQGYLGGVEGKEADGDAGGEDDLGAGRVL